MDDIISAIDTAVGCQQCGKPLEGSVSDDFCGEGCQQRWHANRTALKVEQVADPREPRPAFNLVRAIVYRSDGEGWTEFDRAVRGLEPRIDLEDDVRADNLRRWLIGGWRP